MTVPSTRSGWYFYSRRKADQDLPVLYVRRGAAGKEEVLVDPHLLSSDHYASVSLLDTTRDGTLIAYGIRQGGEDEVTVHFLDVDSRKELPDVLPRGRYSGISVTQDRKTLYFSRHEKEGPRVYVHTMGSDSSKDEKLFGEGYGPEKGISAFVSDDDRYLGILVSHGSAATKTEIYVRDLAKGGPIVPIVNDIEARFSPSFAGDHLYLETNWKAPKGRVLAVDLAHPERESWKEVVAEREVPIAGVSAVGGKLFVRYLENVLAKTRIFDANGKPAGEISFPVIGTLSGMRGRWDQGEGFFMGLGQLRSQQNRDRGVRFLLRFALSPAFSDGRFQKGADVLVAAELFRTGILLVCQRQARPQIEDKRLLRRPAWGR